MLLIVVVAVASCGAGKGSSGLGHALGDDRGLAGAPAPSPTPVPFSLGSASVYTASLNDGLATLTFPDAVGVQPRIVSVQISGSVADGLWDSAITKDINFDIRTDGVDLYFPFSGSYTVRIVVSDNAAENKESTFDVNVPATVAYAVSGKVEDGELGKEVGVSAPVHLLWNPLHATPTEIASVDSDAGDNGSFSFVGLVGAIGNFSLDVDAE